MMDKARKEREMKQQQEKSSAGGKLKDKLLQLALPTTKGESQCLVSFFGFWKLHILHLHVLLQPFIKRPQKLLVLCGAQNKRGFCKGSRWLCKQL